MNRALGVLTRVSGLAVLACLLIGTTPMPVDACSKSAFGGVQPDFFFLFTPLADTVEAGGNGAVMDFTGRRITELGPADTEGPRWGQRVRLQQVAGPAADGLPPETEHLILVPWSYGGDCRPLPWQESARFMEPGQTGFMNAALRDPEHWVDGVPTADVHNPYNHPFPQHASRVPQDALGTEEVFRLHQVLPQKEALDADPRAAVAPLLEWAREHPDLARRWPASLVIPEQLRGIANREVRDREVPVAGTYRFTLDLGDGAPRTFYARTATAPTSPAGMEPGDEWMRELRPPTYAGYSLWAESAHRPELLGAAEPGRPGAYLYVFPDADPGEVAGRVPGGAELGLAARALPDDPEVQALNRAVRERFGTAEGREYIDRNLTPEADAFFLVHPDGTVTFEQRYRLPDGRAVTLQGVRIEAAGAGAGSDNGCPECTVHLTREVTLGDREGPGAVGYSPNVARDGAGRYYLSHVYSRHELLVFDPDGTFLDVVGGPGEGPGEYATVSLVALTDGDTVRVFDNGLRRQTVLAPFPDLSVVRTIPMPAPVGGNRTVVSGAGDLVTSGGVPDPEAVGLPLHLVSSDGARVRSFGTRDPGAASSPGPPDSWALAWAHDREAVWAVHPDEYRIEGWTLEGERVREWDPSPSWFEPAEDGWVLAPGSPPPTRVRAAAEDEEGRLWVLAQVPGEDWESALLEQEGPDGPIYQPGDFARLFDTKVEVMDPDGRLLVSERVPEYLLTFVEPGRVVGYRGTALEMPFLDVYTVELRGR